MIYSLLFFFFRAAAQKHLVPKVSESLTSRSSPITQVCQSLSRLHNAERSYTKNNQDCMVASTGVDSDVKLVKVKQAWTASPEAATSIEVVRRRKKSEPGCSTAEARNLNVINNNNNGSSEAADLNLKRRSYHPQDYLSQVLDPAHSDLTTTPVASSRLKRKDFPKVRNVFLVQLLVSGFPGLFCALS